MDTKLIEEQLGVKILKQLRGAEVLDMAADQVAAAGVYLVERGGQKMILKTGNFNQNEVLDNQKLSDLGIRTRKILDSKPDEYILYEYLNTPLLAQKDYWSDENMKRVFLLHDKIKSVLSDQVPSTGARQEASQWVKDRINSKWLPLLAPQIISEEVADRIRKFYQEREDVWGHLACIYHDNNAEHYVDLDNELAVLDADLTFRPKEYMNMRYLCWVLFKAPPEHIGDPVAWAEKWADYLNATPEHYATWLISLIGDLWDIWGNEKTKGQQIEKTEDIKKVLNWVITKLNL